MECGSLLPLCSRRPWQCCWGERRQQAAAAHLLAGTRWQDLTSGWMVGYRYG